jgi:hypothetical protein
LSKNQKKLSKKSKFCKILSLERCKGFESSRSRKKLQNEYLVVKIGVDTAENEPSKVLQFYLVLIRPRDLIFTGTPAHDAVLSADAQGTARSVPQ